MGNVSRRPLEILSNEERDARLADLGGPRRKRRRAQKLLKQHLKALKKVTVKRYKTR